MTSTTVLNERYELRRRLYSEGNQAAYEAIDRVRRETVLLVLVPPAQKLGREVDRAVRDDLERAFGVCAPTLLPLINVDEDADYRFLVMPMPHGAISWARIAGRKAGKTDEPTLGPEQALRAADDLMSAAKAAHAHGTTLGFSPHQVWIDDRGHAKAQYYWLERVRLASKVGTESRPARFQTMAIEGAHFQAPEITRGSQAAGPAADQFFIGAMLYGLLTGQVPSGSLAPVRATRPDVPKSMAQAIERALAREPRRRHADLDAFRRALYRRRPRLAGLIPLLLLLGILWAGHALVRAGATLEDWAFRAEVDARRDAAFADSRPQTEPVPTPDEAAALRLAGTYATEARDGRVHTLGLERGGAYRYVDGAKDPPVPHHGTWWLDAGGRLVLAPVMPDGTVMPARPARIEDGAIAWTAADGAPLVLHKTGWRIGEDDDLRPLIVLEAPLAGSVATEGEVRVAGTVARKDTRLRIGTQVVPVPAGRFETVWKPGRQGVVELVLEADAPDGFRQTLKRTVVVDGTPPTLDVQARLAPIKDIWTLTVEGSARDDVGLAAVSVNDEPVTLDADGRFVFERKDADAQGHVFAEVVAVDEAGNVTRRLLDPQVVPTRPETLANDFEKVRVALEEGRAVDAENLLRELRDDGGLIEQLDPELVAALVRSGRAPRISLDDYPLPPSYFENDGSQTIELGGEVDWLAPGDKLTVGGVEVPVLDGRFDARTQCQGLGKNIIPVRVMREGRAVASRDVELWLAAPDGDVPTWTGTPVTEAQRAASARYGLPIGHQNDQGMRFVLVPPGAFQRQFLDGRSYEVRVTRPFYVQMREVTRTAFEQAGGPPLPTELTYQSGKLRVDGPDRPALGVPREAAIAFAQRLTAMGKGTYRLPTEAEWELAARGGDGYGTSYWDADPSQAPTWANCADRSLKSLLAGWPTSRINMQTDDRHAGPWPVGTGRANRFGLKDMLGNVAEWVADGYAPFDSRPVVDPKGPMGGTSGVLRGGSFGTLDTRCRFASRAEQPLTQPSRDAGFRLVFEPGGR